MKFSIKPIHILFFVFLLCQPFQPDMQVMAKSVRVVPAGNRLQKQPKIPTSSSLRTSAQKTSFDKKYEKIKTLLQSDKKLISKIKKIADVYDIEPIHMIGAMVGEHTYNINVFDHLQTYYTKAAIYSGMRIRFAYDGENIEDFLKREQFESCKDVKDSYDLWNCRQAIWKKDFQGKTVDGKAFPKDRFSKIFFQPLYAGQTFGLGQISPLTALKLTDFVHEKSGYDKLDETDAPEVYHAIMDPDVSLAYMAAAIRKAIDDYRDIAGLDITKNPGITATLYNIGDSHEHAEELRNKIRRAGRTIWPRENYYGWLVNDKMSELQDLVDPDSGEEKGKQRASLAKE